MLPEQEYRFIFVLNLNSLLLFTLVLQYKLTLANCAQVCYAKEYYGPQDRCPDVRLFILFFLPLPKGLCEQQKKKLDL